MAFWPEVMVKVFPPPVDFPAIELKLPYSILYLSFTITCGEVKVSINRPKEINAAKLQQLTNFILFLFRFFTQLFSLFGNIINFINYFLIVGLYAEGLRVLNYLAGFIFNFFLKHFPFRKFPSKKERYG